MASTIHGAATARRAAFTVQAAGSRARHGFVSPRGGTPTGVRRSRPRSLPPTSRAIRNGLDDRSATGSLNRSSAGRGSRGTCGDAVVLREGGERGPQLLRPSVPQLRHGLRQRHPARTADVMLSTASGTGPQPTHPDATCRIRTHAYGPQAAITAKQKPIAGTPTTGVHEEKDEYEGRQAADEQRARRRRRVPGLTRSSRSIRTSAGGRSVAGGRLACPEAPPHEEEPVPNVSPGPPRSRRSLGQRAGRSYPARSNRSRCGGYPSP